MLLNSGEAQCSADLPSDQATRFPGRPTFHPMSATALRICQRQKRDYLQALHGSSRAAEAPHHALAHSRSHRIQPKTPKQLLSRHHCSSAIKRADAARVSGTAGNFGRLWAGQIDFSTRQLCPCAGLTCSQAHATLGLYPQGHATLAPFLAIVRGHPHSRRAERGEGTLPRTLDTRETTPTPFQAFWPMRGW